MVSAPAAMHKCREACYPFPGEILLGLPGVPNVHVIGNGIVIGSRLPAAIVKVGLEMMCLEPHTHIHGVQLCGETAIGRVDVVTEVFGHLHDLLWGDWHLILKYLAPAERYWAAGAGKYPCCIALPEETAGCRVRKS
jgi:hypothetical protein